MKTPCVAFSLFLVSVVSATSQEVAKSNAQVQAVALLTRPTEIRELSGRLATLKVKPFLLESDFMVGEKPIHDFFLIPGDFKPTTIADEYSRSRDAFLGNMLALDPDATVFPEEVRAFQHDASLSREAGVGAVLISKITVQGTPRNIDRLRTDPEGLFSEVVIAQANAGDRKKVTADDNSAVDFGSVVPQTTPATWYPNSGSTITAQSGTTQRYVLQFMKWNSLVFSWNATYEHDFFLYNYNNDGTYLNPASTPYPGCYPYATYAATNWPGASAPYLDTRFNYGGCEHNELAYTIGAAYAIAINANQVYLTYLVTANGNVNQDKFKLQAQLGHRSPSWCYSTWCSFADSILSLVPAWNSNVPGVVNWTKQ